MPPASNLYTLTLPGRRTIDARPNREEQVRLDRGAEEAVCRTLDRYAERYGAKDVDGVTELFADDPDVLLIGTGADERWVGRPEVGRQFERNFAEAERTPVRVDFPARRSGRRRGLGGCRRGRACHGGWS